jgi:6-phosphogluconolactonase (cycloisomerase 2 family)
LRQRLLFEYYREKNVMHTDSAHRISEYFSKSKSKLFSRLLKALIILASIMYLTACTPGNGEPTYSVGGTVSGLEGSGLIMLNNGGDNLSISADGSFTFATKLTSGKDYSVTIGAYPDNPLQTCTVTNASGTINGADVNNIAIECKSIFTVGGTVGGLTGSGLVLKKNGGDDLSIAADGSFTFATTMYNSDAYAVTVGTQPSGQYCTLTNASGTISEANVINVGVTCRTLYTVGGTISGLTGSGLVLINNGGDDLSISANGSFTFASKIASGNAYAVTVGTRPSGQVCNITNSSGTISGANVTDVAVQCINQRFAYVVSASPGTVSAFTVNTTTGALTLITGSYVSSGKWSSSIAVDPAVKFAYVSNASSNNVSAYAINATTGMLTEISGSPFAAASYPLSIAVEPAGKFVYTANAYSNNVSAYMINATTGALTEITGSPFSAEYYPVSITVDPAGKFAYVANAGSNNVSAYAINATTGALAQISGSPFSAGANPGSIAVDPTGKFAYAADNFTGVVKAFRINSSTGALTEISGSPFAAGTKPSQIAIDPTGKFLYTTNHDSNNVSAYTINATTGALTQISGSPFAAGYGYPTSIAMNPSGNFVYVGSANSNYVYAYTINAITGALTQITGSPFGGAKGPQNLSIIVK